MAQNDNNIKVLAQNRKARFNYTIQETLECGIQLKGTEVKSMRAGKFSFSDAYARIKDDELWLMSFHISQYDFANRFNHDPDRERRLLVHKQEIKRLKRKTIEKGLTLVPLRFYLKKGLIKLEIGLGRGKKSVDKRQDIKKRDQKRELEREFRNKY